MGWWKFPAVFSAILIDGDPMRLRIAPHQVDRLINADWEDPRGAIYVRDDLCVAEAEQSQLFRNARTLLNALDESGGTKATVAGNLNRKFVGEMMEQLDLDEITVKAIRLVNKVINEEDVWDLHLARVILQLAGLIRQHKGTFKVIQKRSHLMADENAGALYQLLFLTFFRKFNLAYLDSMAEVSLLQRTIGLSLFMVSELMNDWCVVEDVAEALFLADVRERMPFHNHFDCTPSLAYTRIVRPLRYFGLLEESEQEEGWRHEEIIKTELFDRVLKFDVQVSLAPGYLH